jgi:hypothetical protein
MNPPQPIGTDQAGYTLFRQAIVDQDAEAWAAICAHYRPLLICWVNRCPASTSIDESSMDLADRALARMWAALTPSCFGKFATLAALLAYLRTCVTAVVIDCARMQAACTRIQQRLDANAIATPEQIVVQETECIELWQLVRRVAMTIQECTILHDCFVLDLPPRTLLTRHPELFADIGTVYTAKRNLLERLRRSPELRQFGWKE